MHPSILRQIIPVLPALLLLPSLAVASDLYRAEVLLFERKGVAPEDVAHHQPPALPDHGLPFWVETQWEPDAETTLPGSEDAILERPEIIPLPQSELRLENIARALESSDEYNVLAFTGWENPFPRGYRTVPLVVDLRTGDEQQTIIRGSIDIERRRYLHVSADLYQLSEAEPALEVAPILQETGYHWRADILSDLESDVIGESVPSYPLTAPVAQTPNWKIDTWLREVRRMRSQEVHYLDAPSFGLVVYFHPIDAPEDADADTDEANAAD